MATHIRTPNIKSGIWTDYDLPPWRNKQLLLHEETVQIITNAIAVATTLALPRLLVLFQVFIPFFIKTARRLPWPLRRRERSRLTSQMLETFRGADTIGAAASELTQKHLGMQHVTLDGTNRDIRRRFNDLWVNFQEDKWTFCIICLAVLSLGAFYIGIQTVAILTSGIVSGSFGLSDSPDCGWWIPPPAASSTPDHRVPTFMLPSEAHYESINYAERHYGTSSMFSAGSAFVSQRINYKERLHTPCPFDSKCCARNVSTFHVDTGYQSSRILGINTAEQHLFRMQSVCTPLNPQLSGRASPVMDKVSIDFPEWNASTGRNVTLGTEQSYHALPGDSYDDMQITLDEGCADCNYLYKKFSFAMDKSELIPRIPTYDEIVKLWVTDDYPAFEVVTLYFIHSCGLRYLQPSNDPIFPANLQDSYGYWTDPTPHPHIIGCWQSSEICGSDGDCHVVGESGLWTPFRTSFSRKAPEAAVLNLLTVAMLRADVSFELPHAPELLAQRLDSSCLSVGLDDGHWRKELRRRFDIRLATVQGLVVDMIQGRHDDTKGGYRMWPGSGAIREACSSLKFRTVGWKNINLVESILFSTSLLILWVSTIRYNDRILLLWLFISLTGPRACRIYEVSGNPLSATFAVPARITKGLYSRILRNLLCHLNAWELQEMSSKGGS